MDTHKPYRVSWRLNRNAKYTAKSAYGMFFDGREVMPGAAELWT
jgi:hypothetical protein